MSRMVVNRILAAALILAILVIGLGTLLPSIKAFGRAILVTYVYSLPDDPNIFDNINARIQSLNNVIGTKLVGRDMFRKMNARLQLLLGKRMLSFGSSMMVWLNDGHLYDVQSDTDVSDDVARMADMKAYLDSIGLPSMYVYAHSVLYEDGLLPAGVVDYNNAVADRIVAGMRDAGFVTIDSRDVYREYDLTMADAALRTDIHWAIPLAYDTFVETVEALKGLTDLTFDERALDIENFERTVYGRSYIGDVGARVGEASVEPDDFMVIAPKYETHMSRSIPRAGGVTLDTQGSFLETNVRTDYLTDDVLENSYTIYGEHNELAYYHNDDAPQGRILIVKDSFGTPFSAFMSLAVSDVCAFDLRKGEGTLKQYVESFKPDAVVFVQCQEMMRGKNYVFVD